MSVMIVLASFNYSAPATGELAFASCVALAILILLVFTRSALYGFMGGGISWGAIAVIVFGSGSGDMAELMQMIYGPFFGVVGAIAGLIAGLIGKAWKSSQTEQEHAGHDDSEYAASTKKDDSYIASAKVDRRTNPAKGPLYLFGTFCLLLSFLLFSHSIYMSAVWIVLGTTAGWLGHRRYDRLGRTTTTAFGILAIPVVIFAAGAITPYIKVVLVGTLCGVLLQIVVHALSSRHQR